MTSRVRSTARGLAGAGRYVLRTARRAADAEGAGESGLARLLEMHAFNTAGDAAVAISLAGSLFFSVPNGQEGTGWDVRGHVALFLGLTMLPFAIVAPVLGPLLDRFAHGRRWAIGLTMVIRAFLTWALADSLPHQSIWMFPEALGTLVMSKAYGVARAAATPRLMPAGFTLVKTNGRVSMAGMVGVGIGGAIALLLNLVSASWVLRYGTLLFVVATILAARLPGKVDRSAGEGTMSFRETGAHPVAQGGRVRMGVPPAVAYALRANCGPKFLSGFLLMFMAFLLQSAHHPVPSWKPTILLGLVAGGAGVGNFLGVAVASLVRQIRPAVTVTLVLVADVAATLLTALTVNVLTLLVLGLIGGLGAALAKFSLDATIQRDIPPQVQTSAFARSDTTVQLAWVVGGFVGVGLTPHAHSGLFVAVAALAAWTAYVLTTRPRAMSADVA